MISPRTRARTRASPRRRYLELLLRTAAHPSAAVAISPLRTLRALLRNEALRRLPIMQQLTGAVVQLGESFMCVYWVAVPKAMRARRSNSARQAAPSARPHLLPRRCQRQ
eukprot:COSAG01_NODE_1041_length_11959_cov_2.673356_5_plen_110_part_00